MPDVIAQETHVVVELHEGPVTVVTECQQGPPGTPGPRGAIGDAGGALLASNRLSELATDPAAQADAQTNIGLGAIDPLAYYILAKA